MSALELLNQLWEQKPGSNGLRSLRLTIRLNNDKVIEAKLWEQNPRKSSQYAARARDGERLAWIIGNDNVFYALVTESDIEDRSSHITEISLG
jgi:hypothetical protein